MVLPVGDRLSPAQAGCGRLHEHADVADALRLRDMRARDFAAMPLSEMLEELGLSADEVLAS